MYAKVGLCRVLGVLSGVADGTEEVDMNRMQSVIKRQILTRLNQVWNTNSFLLHS